MGKGKKQEAVWMVLLRGCLLSLGGYLAGLLLLAFLMVKGSIPENAAFPITAALCMLAVLLGGLSAIRKTPWSTLSSGFMYAMVFMAALIVIGFACWQEIVLGSHGWILLLSVLIGGILAGVLGGGRRKRRKRK